MELPGVITLELGGRGPRRGFVFDPHRLALPCWASSTTARRPALLLTLDRHFDLVPPRAPPAPGASAAELLTWAHRDADPRNVDHVLAAMEAGVIGDALVVARSRLPDAVTADWRDSRGAVHHVVTTATVDALSAEFATPHAGPEAVRAKALLDAAPSVVLDVDLDCFTTPSDADPTEAVPWPVELIRRYVMPRGSDAFWSAVLDKCVALTFAREPGHCGGLISAGRLFEAAAQVVFVELLRTDLP